MLAEWQMAHSGVGVVEYGMHRSVVAAWATHTDSWPDDGCVPRLATVTADLQHITSTGTSAVAGEPRDVPHPSTSQPRRQTAEIYASAVT